MLNPISHEPDIDEIYIYGKDPHETKYQLLINKTESTGLKFLNDSKAFIEFSNDMDDIYKNIKEYNLNKNQKILIRLDDIIADMLSNKKLNPIVTEIFIRRRKLNMSFVFITQSYFTVPKNIRLNSTHYLVMIIPNKKELQQIAFNHSSDINFQSRLYESLRIKNVLQNHIIFCLLILLLYQIILHVSERIFLERI